MRDTGELVFVTRVRTDHFCQGSIWYPGLTFPFLPLTKYPLCAWTQAKVSSVHMPFSFFSLSLLHIKTTTMVLNNEALNSLLDLEWMCKDFTLELYSSADATTPETVDLVVWGGELPMRTGALDSAPMRTKNVAQTGICFALMRSCARSNPNMCTFFCALMRLCERNVRLRLTYFASVIAHRMKLSTFHLM